MIAIVTLNEIIAGALEVSLFYLNVSPSPNTDLQLPIVGFSRYVR